MCRLAIIILFFSPPLFSQELRVKFYKSGDSPERDGKSVWVNEKLGRSIGRNDKACSKKNGSAAQSSCYLKFRKSTLRKAARNYNNALNTVPPFAYSLIDQCSSQSRYASVQLMDILSCRSNKMNLLARDLQKASVDEQGNISLPNLGSSQKLQDYIEKECKKQELKACLSKLAKGMQKASRQFAQGRELVIASQVGAKNCKIRTNGKDSCSLPPKDFKRFFTDEKKSLFISDARRKYRSPLKSKKKKSLSKYVCVADECVNNNGPSQKKKDRDFFRKRYSPPFPTTGSSDCRFDKYNIGNLKKSCAEGFEGVIEGTGKRLREYDMIDSIAKKAVKNVVAGYLQQLLISKGMKSIKCNDQNLDSKIHNLLNRDFQSSKINARGGGQNFDYALSSGALACLGPEYGISANSFLVAAKEFVCKRDKLENHCGEGKVKYGPVEAAKEARKMKSELKRLKRNNKFITTAEECLPGCGKNKRVGTKCMLVCKEGFPNNFNKEFLLKWNRYDDLKKNFETHMSRYPELASNVKGKEFFEIKKPTGNDIETANKSSRVEKINHLGNYICEVGKGANGGSVRDAHKVGLELIGQKPSLLADYAEGKLLQNVENYDHELGTKLCSIEKSALNFRKIQLDKEKNEKSFDNAVMLGTLAGAVITAPFTSGATLALASNIAFVTLGVSTGVKGLVDADAKYSQKKSAFNSCQGGYKELKDLEKALSDAKRDLVLEGLFAAGDLIYIDDLFSAAKKVDGLLLDNEYDKAQKILDGQSRALASVPGEKGERLRSKLKDSMSKLQTRVTTSGRNLAIKASRTKVAQALKERGLKSKTIQASFDKISSYKKKLENMQNLTKAQIKALKQKIRSEGRKVFKLMHGKVASKIAKLDDKAIEAYLEKLDILRARGYAPKKLNGILDKVEERLEALAISKRKACKV